MTQKLLSFISVKENGSLYNSATYFPFIFNISSIPIVLSLRITHLIYCLPDTDINIQTNKKHPFFGNGNGFLIRNPFLFLWCSVFLLQHSFFYRATISANIFIEDSLLLRSLPYFIIKPIGCQLDHILFIANSINLLQTI